MLVICQQHDDTVTCSAYAECAIGEKTEQQTRVPRLALGWAVICCAILLTIGGGIVAGLSAIRTVAERVLVPTSAVAGPLSRPDGKASANEGMGRGKTTTSGRFAVDACHWYRAVVMAGSLYRRRVERCCGQTAVPTSTNLAQRALFICHSREDGTYASNQDWIPICAGRADPEGLTPVLAPCASSSILLFCAIVQRRTMLRAVRPSGQLMADSRQGAAGNGRAS